MMWIRRSLRKRKNKKVRKLPNLLAKTGDENENIISAPDKDSKKGKYTLKSANSLDFLSDNKEKSQSLYYSYDNILTEFEDYPLSKDFAEKNSKTTQSKKAKHYSCTDLEKMEDSPDLTYLAPFVSVTPSSPEIPKLGKVKHHSGTNLDEMKEAPVLPHLDPVVPIRPSSSEIAKSKKAKYCSGTNLEEMKDSKMLSHLAPVVSITTSSSETPQSEKVKHHSCTNLDIMKDSPVLPHRGSVDSARPLSSEIAQSKKAKYYSTPNLEEIKESKILTGLDSVVSVKKSSSKSKRRPFSQAFMLNGPWRGSAYFFSQKTGELDRQSSKSMTELKATKQKNKKKNLRKINDQSRSPRARENKSCKKENYVSKNEHFFNSNSNSIKEVIIETLLHSACKNGYLDVVQFYIYNEQSLDKLNQNLNTPLHCAVNCNNKDIVKLLVDHSADLNIQNIDGNTPLHIAVTKCFDRVAVYLIEAKCDVTIQNNFGNTALHIASYKQNMELIKSLANAGGKFEIQNNKGNTPLHCSLNSSVKLDFVNTILDTVDIFAKLKTEKAMENMVITNCINPFDEICRENLNSKLSINTIDEYCRGSTADTMEKKDKSTSEEIYETSKIKQHPLNIRNFKDESVLSLAIQKCNEDIIKLLILNENLDVESRNKDGDTYLHCAIAMAKLSTTKLVAEAKSKLLNLQNNIGNTPLISAVIKGNISIIEHLISLDVNENIQNYEGNTALHKAIESKNDEIIKLLIRSNTIQMNIRNISGDLPIHCAVDSGSFNIIQCVVEASKHLLNEKNSNSQTVLHLLIQNEKYSSEDKIKLLKCFTESGVNINSQDINLDTVLHISIKRNFEKLMSYLITHDSVSFAIRNRDGETPLHLITKKNNIEIMRAVKCEQRVLEILNNDGKTIFDAAEESGFLCMAEIIFKKRWNLEKNDSF